VPAQAVASEVHATRPPFGAPLTVTQVPAWPASAQEAHCPLQAVLQQTPSTQKPEPQSSPEVQVSPVLPTR
jgi:hypothetical protein